MLKGPLKAAPVYIPDTSFFTGSVSPMRVTGYGLYRFHTLVVLDKVNRFYSLV
jgi:hypothetical protein